MFKVKIDTKEVEKLLVETRGKVSGRKVKTALSRAVGRVLFGITREAKKLTRKGGGVFRHMGRSYQRKSFGGKGVSPGTLSRSLDVLQPQGRLWAAMVSEVPYAQIQAKGGTINHPGSKKLQAWQHFMSPHAAVKGKYKGFVFTMGTRPHTIKIPATNYHIKAQERAAENTREVLLDAGRKLMGRT